MQWPEETNAVAGGDTFWTLITRDCCIILNWVHLKKSRIIFFVIVTYWQSMARFRKNDFFKWAQKIKSVFCFNPHTHEGCDFLFLKFLFQLHVSIHTPTKGVTDLFVRSVVAKPFQSTHPRRVWLYAKWITKGPTSFNPHTHEGCDVNLSLRVQRYQVSIHTPTKGVTLQPRNSGLQLLFQSTHPRRVWRQRPWEPPASSGFNPHTHEGCDDTLQMVVHRVPKFQSTHPRRVWQGIVLRFLLITVVSIHTPTKGVTLTWILSVILMMFQSTHPRRVWHAYKVGR